KILEINFEADIAEIKKAYRHLALEYHPDRNKAFNAAQRFIEITEAYEILRDTTKRTEYDILYREYFFKKEPSPQAYTSYQQKQQTWTDYGEQKAKEYSHMSYEDFTKRVLDEIKIGAGYLPNFFTIALVGIGAISML